MPEPALSDIFAFEPFDGGRGARLSCTTSSARVAVPGTQAVPNVRLLITNGGAVSAFVRIGQSDVVADLNCMEILPGTTVPFSAPSVRPSVLYMAGITETGTTKISIVAGKGV